jgi:hypothetical protein
MLVTNPQLRAPLPDLLNHPWMTRGYEGPPDAHLLRREPLRADELDRQVIRGMTVFEFQSSILHSYPLRHISTPTGTRHGTTGP